MRCGGRLLASTKTKIEVIERQRVSANASEPKHPLVRSATARAIALLNTKSTKSTKKCPPGVLTDRNSSRPVSSWLVFALEGSQAGMGRLCSFATFVSFVAFPLVIDLKVDVRC